MFSGGKDICEGVAFTKHLTCEYLKELCEAPKPDGGYRLPLPSGGAVGQKDIPNQETCYKWVPFIVEKYSPFPRSFFAPDFLQRHSKAIAPGDRPAADTSVTPPEPQSVQREEPPAEPARERNRALIHPPKLENMWVKGSWKDGEWHWWKWDGADEGINCSYRVLVGEGYKTYQVMRTNTCRPIYKAVLTINSAMRERNDAILSHLEAFEREAEAVAEKDREKYKCSHSYQGPKKKRVHLASDDAEACKSWRLARRAARERDEWFEGQLKGLRDLIITKFRKNGD